MVIIVILFIKMREGLGIMQTTEIREDTWKRGKDYKINELQLYYATKKLINNNNSIDTIS